MGSIPDSVTTEQLEAELKIRTAKEKMEELKSSIPQFKQTVSTVNGLKELVAEAKNFVYRYDVANRVLNPSTGKRGRKPSH